MPKCCSKPDIDRRGMLALTGIGVPTALAGLSVARPVRAEAAQSKRPQTPDEALAALKDGNARYIAAPELCVTKPSKQRAAVAEGQSPWATIVSCADSRVPPELIFGASVWASCSLRATPAISSTPAPSAPSNSAPRCWARR